MSVLLEPSSPFPPPCVAVALSHLPLLRCFFFFLPPFFFSFLLPLQPTFASSWIFSEWASGLFGNAPSSLFFFYSVFRRRAPFVFPTRSSLSRQPPRILRSHFPWFRQCCRLQNKGPPFLRVPIFQPAWSLCWAASCTSPTPPPFATI